jgi:hypothetical protein
LAERDVLPVAVGPSITIKSFKGIPDYYTTGNTIVKSEPSP